VVPAAGPPEHIDTAGSKKRLAVFVSGGGSNFKAIHAACQKGTINAEVVVSNRLHSRRGCTTATVCWTSCWQQPSPDCLVPACLPARTLPPGCRE
jgi:hypothetical protein